uniref:Uncharacterized protein n=1 Tax=Anguilla anguilla TaxID=7936 RepID=A0A0E9V5F2_ANGAN
MSEGWSTDGELAFLMLLPDKIIS